VFAVDMESGESAGEFLLPDDVGHPGGLANDRRGTLFVADRSSSAAAIVEPPSRHRPRILAAA
jgi:hypothetical protein